MAAVGGTDAIPTSFECVPPQPAAVPDDSGIQACVRKRTGVIKNPGPCSELPNLGGPPLQNVVCALGRSTQSSTVLATS